MPKRGESPEINKFILSSPVKCVLIFASIRGKGAEITWPPSCYTHFVLYFKVCLRSVQDPPLIRIGSEVYLLVVCKWEGQPPSGERSSPVAKFVVAAWEGQPLIGEYTSPAATVGARRSGPPLSASRIRK